MKNTTHNLIHGLAREADHLWERHKLYLKDAEDSGCEHCKKLWDKVFKNKEENAMMIKEELEKHAKEGSLD